MPAPSGDIDEAKAAHRRLMTSVARVSDPVARQPSLLPDWSVGHVLTHLARNADGHVGQFRAAAGGDAAQQYPGGLVQRAEEIEAGADRPAAELVADLAAAVGRLEEAWETLPEDAWRHGRGLFGDRVRSTPELVYRRWREVEVHHVDLGLAYLPADWPRLFVDREMEALVLGLGDRLGPGARLLLEATDTGEQWVVPAGAPVTERVAADKRRLVAWLLGRLADLSLPILEPWEK